MTKPEKITVVVKFALRVSLWDAIKFRLVGTHATAELLAAMVKGIKKVS